MKTTILASILFAIVPAALVASCTEDDPTTEAAYVKKGFVDCNAPSAKIFCTECGMGGKSACCPEGWECEILCSKWVCDEKTLACWCP